MLVRKSRHLAEVARLESERKALEARVAEVERDFRGCMEHRERQQRKVEAMARRLPPELRDIYRELARASKDSLPPQTPSDPIVSREASAERIRPLLRQLGEAGEVL